MAAAKFHTYEKEIKRCLCVPVLIPYLCQESTLLSFEEGQSLLHDQSSIKRAEMLLKKMKEKSGDWYYTFLKCIRQEKTHLGHAYIQALLEGRRYADQVANSEEIRHAVVTNFTFFTAGINLTELVPYMYETRLLTEHEKEFLQNSCISRIERILFLFSALDSKGPLAYPLFVTCLLNEKLHPTHNELYELIARNVKQDSLEADKFDREWQPLQRTPQQFIIKLHGALQGKEYEELMVSFQACHHNGEWERLEATAGKYSTDGTPYELQAVAHLEVAVSWIFQRQKDKAIACVEKARKTCTNVQGDNSTILRGRCEYILSRLYRYLKEYKVAKEHAEKAKVVLYNVERGEDSAFANYCDACVMVDGQVDEVNTKEIEDCYRVAIDNARRHNSGLDLVEPHSFMRLAQMYLGSTHYTAGDIRDRESIRKAENCLLSVDVKKLSMRSSCHFHLIESDLLQSQGLIEEARKVVQGVLDVSKKYNFTNEIKSAENRLLSL